ncbi:MAG: Bug family tripartite tricarboxylate transporter substrate binding protein [Actinomycetota bacterium]
MQISGHVRARLAGAVAAVAALAVTAACGGGSATNTAAPQATTGGGVTAAAVDFPQKTLQIMVPAAPGGGWDQTARLAQQALEQGKVTSKGVEVFNVPGAGGTVGLARLANEKGNGHLLMTMGMVMVGAVETNKSKTTLADVTPIARLTSEYEAVVVPTNSPYRTLADFVTAWKADPGKLAIAGGSAGGTDQILAGLMATQVGINPKQVNYVAFSGGGEAMAAILGGKVAAGIAGAGEFADQVKAGKLRFLGISSAKRVPGIDAPTLTEGGVAVELANWRGMVAPPGISASDRAGLVQVLTKMHDTQQWKDALAKNKWDDSFLAGDEFASYVTAEQQRIAGVLKELGLV